MEGEGWWLWWWCVYFFWGGVPFFLTLTYSWIDLLQAVLLPDPILEAKFER